MTCIKVQKDFVHKRDFSYPTQLHLSIEYLLFSPQCRKCCESRHDLFSDKKLRLMIGILDILKTKLNEMVIQVPVCVIWNGTIKFKIHTCVIKVHKNSSTKR